MNNWVVLFQNANIMKHEERMRNYSRWKGTKNTTEWKHMILNFLLLYSHYWGSWTNLNKVCRLDNCINTNLLYLGNFTQLFKKIPMLLGIWTICGWKDIMPTTNSQMFWKAIYTYVYSERGERKKQIQYKCWHFGNPKCILYYSCKFQ